MVNQDRAEARVLAEELLDDIELSRINVEQLVLKASRLARLADDYEAEEWLKWERITIPESDSGIKWQKRTGRRYKDGNHITRGATRLAPIIATMHEELKQLRIPELSGDQMLVVSNNIMNRIVETRNAIVRIEGVVASVIGEIHSFAANTFYALRVSERQDSMFEEATESIEQLLSALGAETTRKIDAAYRNLQQGDPESTAAAMLSVRRLIDNFADVAFPACESDRVDGSGNPIKLGNQNHLNRIKALIDDNSQSKSRSDRLKRAIGDIYGRVSAGVHTDVSAGESRYLFMSAYAILGEILSLQGEKTDEIVEVSIAADGQ